MGVCTYKNFSGIYKGLDKPLMAYTGTLLLVTHDRHLMNSLACPILYLEDGKAVIYPSYDALMGRTAPTAETQKAAEPAKTGYGKEQRRRRAELRAKIKACEDEMEACGAREVGQAFPSLATGPSQTEHGLRALAVGLSGCHVEIAAAEGAGHVVERHGQGGQGGAAGTRCAVGGEEIGFCPTRLAVRTADAHQAFGHTQSYAVGQRPRQLSDFVPIRSVALGWSEGVDIGIHFLLSALGSGHIGEIASARHPYAASHAAGEGGRNALGGTYPERGPGGVGRMVESIVAHHTLGGRIGLCPAQQGEEQQEEGQEVFHGIELEGTVLERTAA